MNEIIGNLKPGPNDLVILPEGIEAPKDVDFEVYNMKYLLTPSIIRHGAYMQTSENSVDKFSGAGFLNWIMELGGKKLSNKIEEVKMSESTEVTISGSTDVVVAEAPPLFFRHVRVKDSENGQVLPHGGFTVLVDLDPANDKFQFSYAICSSRDVFNRNTARAICEGRMDKGNSFEISNYITDGLSVIDNIQAAIKDFFTGGFDSATIGSPKFSKLSNSMLEEDFYKILNVLDNRYVPLALEEKVTT